MWPIKEKKEVFILGAGFSKSFCRSIPLMTDLTKLFDDASMSKEYPDLYEYMSEVFAKGNRCKEIKRNRNVSHSDSYKENILSRY